MTHEGGSLASRRILKSVSSSNSVVAVAAGLEFAIELHRFVRLRLRNSEPLGDVAFGQLLRGIGSHQLLQLQYQSHLGVGQTGLLLHRLIDQFHDPIVGVRGESVALLGIEPPECVDECLDTGRLQFVVAEPIPSFDDPRSNQSQRRA